jgi:superfamily II DNA or RNA helicase
MGNLWPHQEKAMKQTIAAFAKGHTAVCVVMSTGAGKTRLGGAFAERHLFKKADGSVLWVAHREELVAQAFDDLTALGLSCGVIQANPTRECNPFRPVQIASTQTLLARGMTPNATMFILDEFHHYASDKWEELAMVYRKRKVPLIGLTATPIRGDGRGFEGLMDTLVCPVTMRELIDQGFLVPFTLVHPPRKLRSDQIAQKPVDAYLEHARGRKAIVFAANIKAAEEYKQQFWGVGVPAGMVWGDMEIGLRRRVLDDYKTGKLQVLTNVGVLTEGFDDRPTSCIILARSVGPLSLYLQMMGRGLRASPETGKVDAVLIDLHGSVEVHGPPDLDRNWTLEGDGREVAKNLEQSGAKFCPGCNVTLEGDERICDLCFIARPEAMPPDVVGIKLVKYAAKLREPDSVRRAYFDKLKAIAVAKGYDRWQPHQKYKAIYGERPPKEWW